MNKIFLYLIGMILSLYLVYATGESGSVTVYVPADDTWTNLSATTFSFMANGTNATYLCNAKYNATSSNWQSFWSETATNGSNTSSSIPLSDGMWLWGIECQSGSAAFLTYVNRTFKKDSTAPIVVPNTFTDSISYVNSNGSYSFPNSSAVWKFTPTDTFLNTCSFFHNQSGSMKLNETNTTVQSGEALSGYDSGELLDGNYLYAMRCNDTVGTWGNTSNYVMVIDRIPPTGTAIATPANNTYSTNQTFRITWTAPTEINLKEYRLAIDTDATHVLNQSLINETISASATGYTFTSTLAVDTTYYYLLSAIDLAGNKEETTIRTYTTDNTAVSVTLNIPSDNSWSRTSINNLNWTASGSNIDTCLIYTDTNIVWGKNDTFRNITSGISIIKTIQFIDNGSSSDMGVHLWNVWCNDTVGNEAWASNNFTLNVDTVYPSATNVTYLRTTYNNSYSTDYTPEVKWANLTTDVNFNSYIVEVSNNSNLNNYSVSYTFSSIGVYLGSSIYGYNLTSYLKPNTRYWFRVNVTDKAGNTNTSDVWLAGNDSLNTYNTLGVCGNLSAGWNLCSIINSEKNSSTNIVYTLYDIGTEIGATYVSKWNNTYQWQTHVTSQGTTGTNADVVLSKGDVAFIYVAATTEWGGVLRDRNISYPNFNIYNRSASSWAIYGMINTTNIDFEYLWKSFSNDTLYLDVGRIRNITSMSYYNNSGSVKYIPAVSKYAEFNNATLIKEGEAIWMQINRTAFISTSSDSGNITQTFKR